MEVLLAVGESLLLVVLVAHERLLANRADEVLNVNVRTVDSRMLSDFMDELAQVNGVASQCRA